MDKGRKPSHQAAARAEARRAAYAPALNAGLQATASRVQEMHAAIAGQTFDNLLRVPGLSAPTRLVQAVHDAISQGVYAAVRQGGAAALAVAGGAERLASDPNRIPGPKEQRLRSALNAAVGDALAAAGNPLAVPMSFHAGSEVTGAPLALQPAALAFLRTRVCVFIHGLACDEASWGPRRAVADESPGEPALASGRPGRPARSARSARSARYGDLLEHELLLRPISAVYLRYNTGLPIEANAQQLAARLGELSGAAPQLSELVLVGHSMGGLVARRALAIAAGQGMPWAGLAAMVVCLGSPHQGAGLAKLGEIASTLLMATDVTRPLGRIANARSQGVKDLRHGLGAGAGADSDVGEAREAREAREAPAMPTVPAMPAVPLRLVYATLGDASDAANPAGGTLMGKLFGDGLVHAASAADDGLTGDVQRVEVTGLGHMGLLNDPRVYAHLRRWLGAPDPA